MSSNLNNASDGSLGKLLLPSLLKAVDFLVSAVDSRIDPERLPESKVLTISRQIHPVDDITTCRLLAELKPRKLPAIVDVTFVGIWKGASLFWLMPSYIAFVDELQETWNFRLGLGPFKPAYKKFKVNRLSAMTISSDKLELPMASIELDCSACCSDG